MSKIFFTSDTHYWHRNIAGPKVSVWKAGYRNFNDEQEMSREIVKQINKTVGYDDVLYHLGDWSFGGLQNIWNFRKQINCRTIHLLLGNHDQHIEKNKELPNCWYDTSANCFYDTKENDWCVIANAKQLFTSVNQVLEIKHGKHSFFLSHYAHRVWNGLPKGVIHLYGHSHNTIEEIGKSQDVGIDVSYALNGTYRPMYIEEIIDRMSRKEVIFFDHHKLKYDVDK